MARILSKKQRNKCHSPTDLARAAGFVVREMNPWRVQVVYYLLDEFDKLRDIFPDAEDIRPCGACVEKIEVDGWDLLLIGVMPDADPAVTAGRIAHEAVHCVSFVFNARGQKYDTTNDEISAYSVEMLTVWGMWAVEEMMQNGKEPKG